MLKYPSIMQSYPLITAIVTNYNGWDLGVLPDFFKAFLKNDYNNLEIIFIDMNSSDNSVKKVKKHFGKDKRLSIIVNPVNNMSLGINMAMKQSHGKYILFLNNDIYFDKRAIKRMVNFMETNNNTAIVQGKIVSYYDHNRIDDCGETMDIYGNPITIGAKEEDRGQYNKKKEILSVTGAASLFRASLVDKIGYLDADYGIGYEDMDLAIRTRLIGYKIYYLPDVVVYHKRAVSTSSVSHELKVKLKYGFNKNRLATLIKNFEVRTLLKSLPIVVLIYIILGLFEMFYKKLWSFGLTRFKALGWMFLNIPMLIKKRKEIQKTRLFSDKEAIMPFLVQGQILSGFMNFLKSKSW